MKVSVFSRQTIKPSSPTPTRLRHVQLSFLDQINNPVFMPMVYFYPSEPGSSDDIRVKTTLKRTDRLKSSLSEILSRFYPLAGRVKEDRFIECNDTGVYYTEAEAKCQLSQFLAQPDPAKLNKLLPCELEDSRDLLLAIQVNIFDCGGIGIGVCFSHIIMDAISIVTFMNSWAAVGRGERCNAVLPWFNLASLFPPKDISNFNRKVGIAKEKIVTKRFVFTDSVISALRAKYAAKPTRIEALSTFIWCRYVVATRGVANTPRVYSVVQAVNLRPRMNPPLPDSYFGNLSRFAVAFPSLDTNEEGFDLVTQMRDAVRKIDDSYVKKLQEGDEHLNFIKGRAENLTKGEVDSFRFTSLCHFPLYGADFGWGKPVWVTMATLPYKNLTLFMPTRYGQGIEAWINMEENDIAKLEADKEFVAFVSKTSLGNRVMLRSSL